MKDNKHIVIVGAGIVGLSTAYFLQKSGFEVTIIDNTDGSDNCSFGNAGYVSPSHIVPLSSPGIISQGLKWVLDPESPFYIKPRLDYDLISWGLNFKRAATKKRVKAAVPVLNDLTLASRTLYEGILSDESLDPGYNDKGLLMLCKTKHGMEEEAELAHLGKEYGLKTEILSAQEVQRFEPGLAFDIEGAVYFEDDRCMTPNVFMQDFKQKLLSKGIDIRFNTSVEGIRYQGSKIEALSTNSGEITADEYIITAGVWTSELMKKLRIKLPMQGGKGYSFMLENPVKKLNLPSILTEARIATTPMLHGLRIAGTMEIAGNQLGINQRRVQGLVKALPQYLPDFEEQDFSKIEPWAGLRPCSPDGLPYIGRSQKISNLLVGTGHAMLGFTLGPITGHLLAQEVRGEQPQINSPLLAVERYHR